MIWTVLIVWIICCILSYGLIFAYLQRNPGLISDEEMYFKDLIFAISMSIFGPFSLIGFISAWLTDDLPLRGFKWW